MQEVIEKCLDGEMPEGSQRLQSLLDIVLRDQTKQPDELWITSLEELPELIVPALVFLVEKKKRGDLVDKLISFCLNGIKLEVVMKHSKPAYIVRHLRSSIKLVAALCISEPKIAEKFIKHGVQNTLMNNLEYNYMSLPMQLHILKALDASCFFPVGFLSFLYKHFPSSTDSTCYQKLVLMLTRKQPSRLVVAIKALLKKLQLYLLVKNVFLTTEKISNFECAANAGSSSRPDISAEQPDKCVSELCDMILEIVLLYRNAAEILVQPRRSVPASVIFDLLPNQEDPYPSIYQMFLAGHLLDSLLVLLTSQCANNPCLASVIQALFLELLSQNSGVIFLASQQETTKQILNVLLQQSDENREEEPTCYLSLGVDLAYNLQALQLIDVLMHYHSSGLVQLEMDNQAVLSTLHSLYVLTFDQTNEHEGRRAVVRLLGFEKNADSILPFIELTGDSEWDDKMKKSACTGYATELLLLLMRYSDSVRLLRTFGEKLMLISSQDVTSKTAELKQWVEVLKRLPCFCDTAMEYLCDKLKVYFPEDKLVGEIPKSLITTVRIMKYLTVPPSSDIGVDHVVQLRYMFSAMQLHSSDSLTKLVKIADAIVDSHLISWQQGISLNNNEGSLIFACILPTLSLIRATLSVVIRCRRTEFADTTAVKTLLKVFTTCCTMLPPKGFLAETAVVRQEVISTLLSFTQPYLGVKDLSEKSFEATNRSLWTSMVAELLDFTLESCHNFVGGLNALVELLPLPLPVQTVEPLSNEDLKIIVSNRSLWSAHLIPLSTQLANVIHGFANATHSLLQQSLRRVCLQLSDLSEPIADVIVRSILSLLLENAEAIDNKDLEIMEANREQQPNRLKLPAPSELAYVLNLISFLSSHGPFKVVLLNLLQSSGEGHSFNRILSYFLKILNCVSTEEPHQHCQEYVVSILQSLCDVEIGLVPAENQFKVSDVVKHHKAFYFLLSGLLQSLPTSECKARVDDKRTSFDTAFLREIFDWKSQPHQSLPQHPLTKLSNMLQEKAKEDITLHSLHDKVENIIEHLMSASDYVLAEGCKMEVDEPDIPSALGVAKQFSLRKVYAICKEVLCDLEMLRQEFFPNYNMREELLQQISLKQHEAPLTMKRKLKPGIINTSQGLPPYAVAALFPAVYRLQRASMTLFATDHQTLAAHQACMSTTLYSLSHMCRSTLLFLDPHLLKIGRTVKPKDYRNLGNGHPFHTLEDTEVDQVELGIRLTAEETIEGTWYRIEEWIGGSIGTSNPICLKHKPK
ncbi:unnamed protein product [Soboliphyme baturini]|uniref:Glomulin n=1 Tax=Soboliphyme baturini TaxID=241478 RepID=A0A183IF33_9BILA|nr:unnamed protein product [Soboliphyme baturini]